MRAPGAGTVDPARSTRSATAGELLSEVGPYALGPTDYVVSRADLVSLARADGPLASAP